MSVDEGTQGPVCAWVWAPSTEKVAAATRVPSLETSWWVGLEMATRDNTSHNENGNNDPGLNLPLIICLLCNRHFLEGLVQSSNNPPWWGDSCYLQVRGLWPREHAWRSALLPRYCPFLVPTHCSSFPSSQTTWHSQSVDFFFQKKIFWKTQKILPKNC